MGEASVENLHDARVFELAQNLHLRVEPFLQGGGHQGRMNHLDCHIARDHLLGRAPDRAHASFPEFFAQSIAMSHDAADSKGRGSHRE